MCRRAKDFIRLARVLGQLGVEGVEAVGAIAESLLSICIGPTAVSGLEYSNGTVK